MPGGSQFTPGPTPPQDRWFGSSALKYAYRLDSLVLRRSDGVLVAGTKPLQSVWGTSPYRQPDASGTAGPLPSEHEGPALKLLDWSPWAWVVNMTNGGAGQPGDPVDTIDDLCDPKPAPQRTCVLGRTAEARRSQPGPDALREAAPGAVSQPVLRHRRARRADRRARPSRGRPLQSLITLAGGAARAGLGRGAAVPGDRRRRGGHHRLPVPRRRAARCRAAPAWWTSRCPGRAMFSQRVTDPRGHPADLRRAGQGTPPDGGGECDDFTGLKPDAAVQSVQRPGLHDRDPGRGRAARPRRRRRRVRSRPPSPAPTAAPRSASRTRARDHVRPAVRPRRGVGDAVRPTVKGEALAADGSVLATDATPAAQGVEHRLVFAAPGIAAVRLRGGGGEAVIIEVCCTGRHDRPDVHRLHRREAAREAGRRSSATATSSSSLATAPRTSPSWTASTSAPTRTAGRDTRAELAFAEAGLRIVLPVASDVVELHLMLGQARGPQGRGARRDRRPGLARRHRRPAGRAAGPARRGARHRRRRAGRRRRRGRPVRGLLRAVGAGAMARAASAACKAGRDRGRRPGLARRPRGPARRQRVDDRDRASSAPRPVDDWPGRSIDRREGRDGRICELVTFTPRDREGRALGRLPRGAAGRQDRDPGLGLRRRPACRRQPCVRRRGARTSWSRSSRPPCSPSPTSGARSSWPRTPRTRSRSAGAGRPGSPPTPTTSRRTRSPRSWAAGAGRRAAASTPRPTRPSPARRRTGSTSTCSMPATSSATWSRSSPPTAGCSSSPTTRSGSTSTRATWSSSSSCTAGPWRSRSSGPTRRPSRRRTLLAEALAPLDVALTLYDLAQDRQPEGYRRINEALLDPAIAPCVPTGAPMGGTSIAVDADLAPDADYDLDVVAPKDGDRPVVLATRFRTSHYASPRALVDALGYTSPGVAPFLPDDLLIPDGMALPAGGFVEGDAALDAALAAIDAETLPLPTRGARSYVAWSFDETTGWHVEALVVDSPEPHAPRDDGRGRRGRGRGGGAHGAAPGDDRRGDARAVPRQRALDARDPQARRADRRHRPGGRPGAGVRDVRGHRSPAAGACGPSRPCSSARASDVAAHRLAHAVQRPGAARGPGRHASPGGRPPAGRHEPAAGTAGGAVRRLPRDRQGRPGPDAADRCRVRRQPGRAPDAAVRRWRRATRSPPTSRCCPATCACGRRSSPTRPRVPRPAAGGRDSRRFGRRSRPPVGLPNLPGPTCRALRAPDPRSSGRGRAPPATSSPEPR